MSLRWKKKPGCNLQRVLADLEHRKRIDAKSNVSFVVDGLYDDSISLLSEAFECNSDLSSAHRRGMILPALGAAGKNGELKPANVLSALRHREAAYLTKPIIDFFLCTHLTMKHTELIRSVRIAGVTVTTRAFAERRFTVPDHVRRRIDLQTGAIERPMNRTWARIRTRGRTEYDAGEYALDALTLLRSLWNLHINFGRSRWSGGYHPAINEILAGPAHTLHHLDGTMASEMFWYERRFAPQRSSGSHSRNWEQIERNRRYWQSQLRRCEYRDAMEGALRRYASALDDSDYEVAFLKLWALLEFITDTPYSNYDKTIRRAVFLWNDQDHHSAILGQLRKRRNEQVHASTFDADPEESAYILKRYVDQLLLFHLNSKFRFRTLSEAGEFLDLPSSDVKLRRRKRLITEALAWMRQREI